VLSPHFTIATNRRVESLFPFRVEQSSENSSLPVLAFENLSLCTEFSTRTIGFCNFFSQRPLMFLGHRMDSKLPSQARGELHERESDEALMPMTRRKKEYEDSSSNPWWGATTSASISRGTIADSIGGRRNYARIRDIGHMFAVLAALRRMSFTVCEPGKQPARPNRHR
jgi:hypothetical protein